MVAVFNTCMMAGISEVPDYCNEIMTSGYQSVGDGGQGFYKRVYDDSQYSFDLITLNNKRFRPIGMISALQFGADNTASSEDSETLKDGENLAQKNAIALQKFMDAIASGLFSEAKIPAGKYLCAAPIVAVSDKIMRLNVDARGATIVFTTGVMESKRYFEITNLSCLGEILHISGLECRHNRPSSRIKNTDMVSYSGFDKYFVMSPIVSSSDNMGLVFGRRDSKKEFTPSSIYIENPMIGGWLPPQGQHEYGSIGDSGIWVVRAAKRTTIVNPYVRSTGDDGILVGETTDKGAGNVTITDADIEDCGASGIKISVAKGRITGRIVNTNGPALYAIKLQGVTGDKLRVDLVIDKAGQLQAGEIGKKMIGKFDPVGICLVGANTSQFDLEGTVIRNTFASAIVLRALEGQSLSHITGRVICDHIGYPSNGSEPKRDTGIINVGKSSKGTISDVDLELIVSNSQVPVLNWVSQANALSQKIHFKIRVKDHLLHSVFDKQALLSFSNMSLNLMENSLFSGVNAMSVTVDLDVIRGQFKTLLYANDSKVYRRVKLWGRVDGKELVFKPE